MSDDGMTSFDLRDILSEEEIELYDMARRIRCPHIPLTKFAEFLVTVGMFGMVKDADATPGAKLTHLYDQACAELGITPS